MSRRASILGVAVAIMGLLTASSPALAGGRDSGNGTPITLSISQAAGGAYTFTVSKFNGQALSVGFYIVGKEDVDKDGTLIGYCSPNPDVNNTTVVNEVLTCTFKPQTAFPTGAVQVEAAEYDKANPGAGNYVENNEVKEESNPVTINNGIPQNNLPEVPYAVVLPVIALGAIVVLRRRHAKVR